jgi:hypothetical protein
VERSHTAFLIAAEFAACRCVEGGQSSLSSAVEGGQSSLSSAAETKEFLDLRSNADLGNDHVDNDVFQPSKDEIRTVRLLATVLPQTELTRALLRAIMVCNSDLQRTLNEDEIS